MPTHLLRQRAALLVVAAPVFGGCATYDPQPLDLPDHVRSFRERGIATADSAVVLRPAVEAALTLLEPARSESSTRPSTRPVTWADGTLSLDEAERVALLFNREVRVARAEALGQAASVSYAGLMDDLLVDVDVLRVVEDVEEPWIFGAGVGFTIPLSGRLGLERDLAGAEAGAEWRRAVEAELDVLLELRRRWLQWSAARERVAVLRDYLDALAPVRETAQRLSDAGEVGPTEARLLAIEAASRRAELAEAEADVVLARVAVLETMGLLPTAPLDLAPLELEQLAAVSLPDLPPTEALVRHPAALAAEAHYLSAERRLRLEVRRQVPDLAVGPLYESENDQTRIGVGLTLLPVPIFNRNRRGIAEAEAARDVARAQATAVVEELATTYAAAKARLDGALARLRVLDEDVLPLVEEQQTFVRQLADLGELNVLVLVDVFQASLELRRNALEARLAAAEARVTLDALLDPPVARPGREATDNPTRSEP